MSGEHQLRFKFMVSFHDALDQREAYRAKVCNTTAMALLSAGLALVPCAYLEDYQAVVSEGVYKAADRLVDQALDAKERQRWE